jgi:hypothetical protein
MDDDPMPKALIGAMDDLDDFKRCWKHFTRSSLSKSVLITQRNYAVRDRLDRYNAGNFIGGSGTLRITTIRMVLPNSRPGHGSLPFLPSALIIHPCFNAPELRQISIAMSTLAAPQRD